MAMHSRRAVSLLRRAAPSVARPKSTLPLPSDGAGGRLRFDDARLAFDGVPTADLVRALCVFQACGVGPLVAHGERLLAAARRVLGDRAVAAVVRPTFFAHFVAGEDEAEVRAAVEGLRSRGVGAILDYAAEADVEDAAPGAAPPPSSRVYDYAGDRAAQESDTPNFKGSYLGRFPLVSADFWTSDHLSERSRSVDASSGTRARGTLTLKRR
jgi:hypothetical protein